MVVNTVKTYKCPYCEIRKDRDSLIKHIEFEHEEMIPKDHTPSRIVFNIVNKKDHGICVACKKETDWNEQACKYDRNHNTPKCKAILRKIHEKNMIKVYKKTTLLNDAEHQTKMLANRSISGTYTFSDGGKRTYTGSFEKKTLEFIDKVLNIHSDDIMTPGPIFEYKYNGKTLKWITDILYIPFNLVIEVKDGGSNPNNRNMEDYREKQTYKEKMITNLGTYNYLRLTNNNFEQLLEVLAELKMQMIDDSDENKKVLIKINEMAPPGGVPPAGSSGYVIHYGYNSVLAGEPEDYALADDIIPSKLFVVDKETRKIKKEDISFLDNRQISIYKYIGDKDRYISLLKEIKSNDKEYDKGFFYKYLSECDLLSDDQIEYDPLFEEFDINKIIAKVSSEAATIIQEFHSINKSGPIGIPLMKKSDIIMKNRLLENYNNLDILEDHNGYYVKNINTGIRSTSKKNMEDLIIEGVI